MHSYDFAFESSRDCRSVCRMNDNMYISWIAWGDTLKGIAIILVVIVHNAGESVSDFLQCFIMPLFFLLSGFLFSPKTVKEYFHKSTRRLIVPYTAFLIVIALPYIILMAINGELFETKGKLLLINMLYGGEFLKGSFGLFWCISVLWVSYNTQADSFLPYRFRDKSVSACYCCHVLRIYIAAWIDPRYTRQ